jgi:hypothetical protein
VHVLAPNTFATPSTKTILAFCHFHPLAEVDLAFFVNDFHLEMDHVLDKEAFIYVLPRFPCLSFDGPLRMVYELLRDCFVLDNFVSGFDFFFETCGHITHGHVSPLLSHLLVASRLLALEK